MDPWHEQRFCKSTSSTTNWFGYDIGYDKTSLIPTGGSSIGNYTAQQFNGNITGIVWKSTGDDEIRKFDYSYDALNRLISADFNQYTSGFNKNAGIDFSVSNLSYDANGNILSMKQKGLKLLVSQTIDSLAYSFQAYSNRLIKVTDGINSASSKLDDFKDGNNGTADDYTYDVNGNLTTDLNKGITNIAYNHLNLPESIHFLGKGIINYTYDATGNKLKKVTTDSLVTPVKLTTTLYINGSIYRNDTLELIGHEEGRIRFNPSVLTLNYDYFLKDYLGSTRMVLSEEYKTDAYPAATMETAESSLEESLYSNISQTRTDKPSGYPSDTYTDPNDKVSKVRGDGNRIGPAIILKVMAGDTLNIRVNSWWSSGSTLVRRHPP